MVMNQLCVCVCFSPVPLMDEPWPVFFRLHKLIYLLKTFNLKFTKITQIGASLVKKNLLNWNLYAFCETFAIFIRKWFCTNCVTHIVSTSSFFVVKEFVVYEWF